MRLSRAQSRRPSPRVVRCFRYAGVWNATEVQLEPELEQRLNDLVAQSGRPAGDLVHDAVASSSTILHANQELDTRYDEIKSGKVILLDGEVAFTRLHERIEARRRS
jgi:predicted DNA-binding protein